MYRVTNDCPTSDIIDVDLDKQATEDDDERSNTTYTSFKAIQKKEERKMTIQVPIIVRMMLETI